MNDALTMLSQTPLPTILVVAGIVFWILAVAGSLAGKITVEPGKQKAAGLVGTAFIVLGLILLVFPTGPTDKSETAATTPPSQAAPPPAATTTAPTPAPVPPAPVATTTALSSPASSNRAGTGPSPGVNCSGTGTPDEVAICANSSLAALDRQLYAAYQAQSKGLNKAQQTKLAQDESAWVKQRGECHGDVTCLTAAYQARIDQLQSAH